MDIYESDSSVEGEGEVDGEYTETNVNLGYASKEATEDTISHLGGFPTWLDPTTTPSPSSTKCKVCNEPTSLLLLLNTDLPQHFPNDERRLHVFSCRKRRCSRKPGSIRAVREVKKHQAEHTAETKGEKPCLSPDPGRQFNDLGATIFGATSSSSASPSANPFSTTPSQISATTPNLFTSLPPTSTLAAKSPQLPTQEPPTDTFASKLRISSPPLSPPSTQEAEPRPHQPAFSEPFPYLHLDADYEILVAEKRQIPDASAKTQIQYSEEDATAMDSVSLEKDIFESNLDKAFLKFSDRIAQNPEQVLRYEWKGTPLLYSSDDAVGRRFTASHVKSQAMAGMPRCESCGADRVFEVQLVPGAIAALEDDDVNVEEGMEWGTIIVGVCGRNCGQSGEVEFKEEWCGVQWEG